MCIVYVYDWSVLFTNNLGVYMYMYMYRLRCTKAHMYYIHEVLLYKKHNKG